MTAKIFRLPVLILFCVLSLGSAPSDMEAIKARMMERLPVIMELKAEGIIGENNKGYLQFIGEKRVKEDIVNAENNDRRTVYEAIAKEEKVTVEFVGTRRALQIVEKAVPGEWLQDKKGNWYKKK